MALSWDTFVAQFGGNLGLYLGVSFASLVHIPVFFIRLLASVAGKKYAKSLKISSNHIENPEVKPCNTKHDEIESRYQTQQEEISLLASRVAALEERNAETSQASQL